MPQAAEERDPDAEPVECPPDLEADHARLKTATERGRSSQSKTSSLTMRGACRGARTAAGRRGTGGDHRAVESDPQTLTERACR
jgi:hypothetical protein